MSQSSHVGQDVLGPLPTVVPGQLSMQLLSRDSSVGLESAKGRCGVCPKGPGGIPGEWRFPQGAPGQDMGLSPGGVGARPSSARGSPVPPQIPWAAQPLGPVSLPCS